MFGLTCCGAITRIRFCSTTWVLCQQFRSTLLSWFVLRFESTGSNLRRWSQICDIWQLAHTMLESELVVYVGRLWLVQKTLVNSMGNFWYFVGCQLQMPWIQEVSLVLIANASLVYIDHFVCQFALLSGLPSPRVPTNRALWIWLALRGWNRPIHWLYRLA